MTNIASQPRKSAFKYFGKKKRKEKLGRSGCKKFPFASFHKCVIGGWCLTPRRQVFVFPFLKPKVGLFRFSQADYSHGPAPEGEKIIISVSPASPGHRLRTRTKTNSGPGPESGPGPGPGPEQGPGSGPGPSIVLKPGPGPSLGSWVSMVFPPNPASPTTAVKMTPV